MYLYFRVICWAQQRAKGTRKYILINWLTERSIKFWSLICHLTEKWPSHYFSTFHIIFTAAIVHDGSYGWFLWESRIEKLLVCRKSFSGISNRNSNQVGNFFYWTTEWVEATRRDVAVIVAPVEIRLEGRRVSLEQCKFPREISDRACIESELGTTCWLPKYWHRPEWKINVKHRPL